MNEKPELTPEDTTIPLPEAAPKRLPTRKEIGQWRRAMITIVHPTVNKCGHKIATGAVPKNNCVPCWQAYFAMYCDIENLMNHLRDGSFKARYGDKMYKNFRAFVALELKKMQGENALSEKGEGSPSQES